MIASLAFSIVAAGLVFLAGRKDAARDPKLTVSLLILLAAIPVMAAAMPKISVLPALAESAREAAFPWGKMLATAWALGFAIAVARLGIAANCLRRWRNQALEVDRIDGVAICELPGLQGPVAAGVWNPVILVPATWQTGPMTTSASFWNTNSRTIAGAIRSGACWLNWHVRCIGITRSPAG